LKVDSAWKLETKIAPLTRVPFGDLANALKKLESGEEWALMPENFAGHPNLWTPGIKYGVRPGSHSHLTEFFGPVLSVMRFENLARAVALVNQTGYGLTSGLESLDEREWDFWKEHIRAGNLYINRVTTGAVVLRQPFGGMGKSAFGPGMKAGGPNYVVQFMNFKDGMMDFAAKPSEPHLAEFCKKLLACSPELGVNGKSEAGKIIAAMASYEKNRREEFGRQHDHFRLVGQDNFRRYLPLRSIRVRVHPADSSFELFARVGAAQITGGHVTISAPPDFNSSALKLLEELTRTWAAVDFLRETDDELAEVIQSGQINRVRYAAPERVPLAVLKASIPAGLCVVSAAVVAEGRLECLWYLQEQSISIDYHRYGNLGNRAGESRAEVA
jgi:RHH-type proline utilization regulon transcriptional repressor/proline dehydrogenase/delta 1-pyrroline-5-carboxylate dehydrogenase